MHLWMKFTFRCILYSSGTQVSKPIDMSLFWINHVELFFQTSKKRGQLWNWPKNAKNFAVDCEILPLEVPKFRSELRYFRFRIRFYPIWPRLGISEKWRKNSKYTVAQLTSSPHFRNIGIIGCAKLNSTNFAGNFGVDCEICSQISQFTPKFLAIFSQKYRSSLRNLYNFSLFAQKRSKNIAVHCKISAISSCFFASLFPNFVQNHQKKNIGM